MRGIGNAGLRASGFFSNAWQGAIGGIETLINGITTVFNNVFGPGGAIRQVISAVTGFFRNAWQSAIRGITTVLNTIIGAANRIPGINIPKIGVDEGGLPGYADGGIVRYRQIAEIAEKGPEAVIPLNNSSRGFDLWQQAGQLGGYLKRAQAATVATTPQQSPVMAAAAQKMSGGDNVIRVDFKMTNNFNGGAPDGRTANQITQAGQKAGEDFEAKVKSVIEAMMRNQRRVSFA